MECQKIAQTQLEIKHYSKPFTVVTAKVSSPLYAMSIVVPTINRNNYGLPHTLEHLIFSGTEKYQKGFLDLMATRCLSNGTNAYTCEDHTVYTLTTCSYSGMMSLLPVFLDHVLNPTLDNFDNEIFYADKDGFKGVVYCEMAGREFTEGDLMDRELRKHTCPNSTYSFEHGGLTRDIIKLTPQLIKDYHEEFYRIEDIALVLTGDFDSATCIAEISTLFPSVAGPNIKPISYSELKMVTIDSRFPSNDEEYGSVGLGWEGPTTDDIETQLALQILFRYLTESSASPMSQRFIEIEDPQANDVDFELKPFLRTSICLIFSGVSTEKLENDYRLLFADLLHELLANGLALKGSESSGISLIRVAVNRHKLKILENLEEDPHSVISTSCIVDILRNRYSLNGETVKVPIGQWLNVLDIIDDLFDRDVEFWKALIEKWLLYPSIRVNLVPCKEMGAAIEAEKAIEHSKHSVKEPESYSSVVKSINFDAPKDVSSMKYSQNTNECDIGGFKAIQVLELETHFSHIVFGLSLEGIDPKLLKYLVLFQELLFNSPIGDLSFQQVVKELSADLVNYEAGVGFGNDLFSCNYLSNYLIVRGSCLPSKTKRMFELLLQVLCKSDFELERLVILRTLQSHIVELKREGNDMLQSISTLLLHRQEGVKKTKSVDIDLEINLLHQESFINTLVDELNSGSDMKDHLNALNELRFCLIQKANLEGNFVQFGFNQSLPKEELIDEFSALWKQYSQQTSSAAFPFPIKNTKLLNYEKQSYSISISSLTAYSVLKVVSVPELDVRMYHSLNLLFELLNRVDGFLYNAVRGSGLAYGAYFSTSFWDREIRFMSYEAIDPIKVIDALRNVIDSVESDCENLDSAQILTKIEFETAKAAYTFSRCQMQSTASLILTKQLQNAIKPEDFDVSELTLQDIASACPLLKSFKDCFTLSIGSSHVESFHALDEPYV